MSEIKILIPDGEHPFLMRVAPCFSSYKHIKLFAMSNTRHFPMRYSNRIHHITYINETDETQWISEIDHIVEEHSIDLIMPVNEDAIKTLITNKHLLESKDKLVKLSHIDDYTKSLDKAELALHLQKHQIPHPETLIYDPKDNSFQSDTIEFPQIAKPATGYGGEGIVILKDTEGFNNLIKANKNKIKYVIQEFIEGYDIDCSVLCYDGKIIAHTIQKGVLFEKKKFAPAIGLQFSRNKQLFNTVQQLMASLNWSGVAHIDLRFDSNTNDYKVIEINGRFWSSLDASAAAGVNFPYLYSLNEDDVHSSLKPYKEIRFFNLKGLSKSLRKNPLIAFKFRFLKNNTSLPSLLKDLKPRLIMVWYKVKQVLRLS